MQKKLKATIKIFIFFQLKSINYWNKFQIYSHYNSKAFESIQNPTLGL